MRVVYEAANVIDAHLVKHVLEAEGLPVYLRGESLIGGMGELPLFGVVAVCVPASTWADARRVIQSLPLVRGEPHDDAPALGWAHPA